MLETELRSVQLGVEADEHHTPSNSLFPPYRRGRFSSLMGGGGLRSKGRRLSFRQSQLETVGPASCGRRQWFEEGNLSDFAKTGASESSAERAYKGFDLEK